jgi:hypothetical protein
MILQCTFVNQCLLAVVRISTGTYQAFLDWRGEMFLLTNAFADYLNSDAYGLCNQVVDERPAFRSGWHDVSGGGVFRRQLFQPGHYGGLGCPQPYPRASGPAIACAPARRCHLRLQSAFLLHSG